MSRIWIAANTSWYALNFRARLMDILRAQGHEVSAWTPKDDHADSLLNRGIRHIPLVIDNAGTNPLKDSAAILRMTLTLRRHRPDVLLTFTPKVNIYGCISARLNDIPVIANVSGLGSGFLRGGWLHATMRMLYRLAFLRTEKVFFQNSDDYRLFVDSGLVSPQQAGTLPGSGVDVDHFFPSSTDATPEKRFTFLMVARLLRDKGIFEFIAACRALRQDFPEVRCVIAGSFDSGNPSTIRPDQMNAWLQEGVIEYLGHVDDLRPFYSEADCVVLPSYREGTSRVLLEAASMGKPLIAADVPGCRETIDHRRTGFLCDARNSESLQRQMRAMLDLSYEVRAQMGMEGRKKMLREFDERIVLDAYQRQISGILRSE